MTEQHSNPPSFGKRRLEARRCAGTGAELAPGDAAIRFVLGPDGTPVLDLKEKLPGRGAWLTPDRAALSKALKGGFARAFKAPVKLPDGMDAEAFADQTETLIAQAALGRLGICRKAGALVFGHDTVRKKASRGIAYVTPADASAAETAKMAAFLAKSAGLPHLPVPAGRAILGEAIGQDAAHILLLDGGASRAARAAVILWQRFSGDLSA